MTTFTLRQEHLDLLAKADGPRFSMKVIEDMTRATGGDETKENDLASLFDETYPALRLIMQIVSRGAAVPLGRYRKNDGRWELEP